MSVDASHPSAVEALLGTRVSVRLPCCMQDLPVRVMEVGPEHVSITAPLHLCSGDPVGGPIELTWTTDGRVCRVTGNVDGIDVRRDRWCVVWAAVDCFETEKRYSDASPATLRIGDRSLPVTVADRSLHGVGCLARPDADLKVGSRAVISVGAHERGGVIVRVRREGRSVRVGLQLDPV